MTHKCVTQRPPSSALFVVDNLTEVGLQSSAAYQTTVDVGLSEQLGSAGSRYTAAVLDADSLSSSLIIDLSDASTDSCANFLSLLSGSNLTGTDSPDRLVSDNSGSSLLSGNVQQSDLNLLTDEVDGNALLSLSQSLTTANDRGNAVLECL